MSFLRWRKRSREWPIDRRAHKADVDDDDFNGALAGRITSFVILDNAPANFILSCIPSPRLD
jgi:hypothetical protein